MIIGYLGPEATFTDYAARQLFKEAKRIPFVSIPECMDAASAGEIDAAIVPLENSIEGSVNVTIDYLVHETDLQIVGEAVVPIKQHLLVHRDNVEKWREAELILSHPHALAQCHKFLHKEFKGIPLENMSSTAAAAIYVQNHPERNIAAIANNLAAEEYGLATAEKNVHDYSYNHTVFAVLAKEKHDIYIAPTEESKTSLMITLPSDRAGALHQVLSAFSWRKLNLSKIESRPMKTGLGKYFFIIDINLKMDDVLIPGAIAELEALGCTVKLIGSYSSHKI
ncbi:prephenate dehydratase [Mesobacillus boroniphilus]|uniref:Prephenate dehydratase n=1 Tax=Mesobacillus boroniphilus TaxID=308892 RepID=A0A944GWK9_9BACI|nr:prephenate dehydratase [Mesobacillus boroniphilus]MBS8265058.1 prephenate dehydratase [Mesobacillus boroniphilus]